MQNYRNSMTESFINKISVIDIVEDTVVDGPGFRVSIYCAGCPHHCAGCHNPESWSLSQGKWMSVESLFERICSVDFNDVTFTGGDPMFQPIPFATLAKRIKEQTDKTIWCYTGYRYEELVNHPKQLELLRHVDVLVDGPFVEAYQDIDLQFRGSWNQRLIDVATSLQKQQLILWNPERFCN